MELALIAKNGVQRLGELHVGVVLGGRLAADQGLLYAQVAVFRRVVLHAAYQAAALPIAQRLGHVAFLHGQGLGHVRQGHRILHAGGLGIHEAIQVDLYIALRRAGHIFADEGVGKGRYLPQHSAFIALKQGQTVHLICDEFQGKVYHILPPRSTPSCKI